MESSGVSSAGLPTGRGTAGAGRMMMIWLAANLVVTTLLTGTLFVPGLTYLGALLVIVAGTLVGVAVLITIGAVGTRTGLPTMALARGAFGTRGALLPVAANIVVLMGWSWVQAMLAGLAVDYMVHSATGFSSPVLFAVLCEVIVVGLAVLGHEGIEKVEPWLAVIILLTMAGVFYAAFTTFSPAEYAAIERDPGEGLTGGIAFDIVFATAISWTVLSADINRLASTTRRGIIGTAIGYSLSTIIAMTMGATLISYVVLSGGEVVAFDLGTVVAPFGWTLALVIFFSVMATNTMAVYGMVTTAVNALPGRRLPFVPTALVLGAISVLGSTWFGLLDQFTDFLVLIGAFFVPVFAIMIVDYYLLNRARYDADLLRPRGGRYWYLAGINPAAVAVWVTGAATSWMLTYLWPTPIGTTMPVFVLSLVLYAGASVLMRSRTGTSGTVPGRSADAEGGRR